MTEEFTEGMSVRSTSGGGNARTTYHPRFSWQPEDFVSSLPWSTFINGTAGRAFETHTLAVCYLESRGFKFADKVPR